MAIRVVELGLFETKTAYLRNGWNVVDAIGECAGDSPSFPPDKSIVLAHSRASFSRLPPPAVAWVGILYYLVLAFPPPGINRASALVAFNTIRSIRAVRPLRILRRFENVRIVVSTRRWSYLAALVLAA